MDREARCAVVHGVAKSWTCLKNNNKPKTSVPEPLPSCLVTDTGTCVLLVVVAFLV